MDYFELPVRICLSINDLLSSCKEERILFLAAPVGFTVHAYKPGIPHKDEMLFSPTATDIL